MLDRFNSKPASDHSKYSCFSGSSGKSARPDDKGRSERRSSCGMWKVVHPKPALTTAHHPSSEPRLFNRDVQQAAIVCNSHQHSSTCHSGRAGKIGCRLARPQALVNKVFLFRQSPDVREPKNSQNGWKKLNLL